MVHVFRNVQQISIAKKVMENVSDNAQKDIITIQIIKHVESFVKMYPVKLVILPPTFVLNVPNTSFSIKTPVQLNVHFHC